MKIYLLLIFTVVSFFSCKQSDKQADQKVTIVCTTGMLGDALHHILPEDANIITLMGSGVDPHLYKATQADVEDLMKADIIVYNGLHLEGKMGEIFEKLETQKMIVAAGAGIPPARLINNSDFQGAYDPHIWFDVELWSEAMGYISEELAGSGYFDSTEIAKKWEDYRKELRELHLWTKKEIASIPEDQRTLITSHDAFSYFGRAYHINVRGLQGISTVSEYGLKDISELVEYISRSKIKSVFIESSVSDRSMQAVIKGCQARGHQVQLGGTLFSDAMGEENSPEGTYVGMVRYNVSLIKKGLSK